MAPGWFRDPFVRHEQRYWSGSEWTDHVIDDGVPATDPPPSTGGGHAAPDPSDQAPGQAPLGRQLPAGHPQTWSTAGGMVTGHAVPGPVLPAAKAVHAPPPDRSEHVVRTLVLGRHLGPGRIRRVGRRSGHQPGTGPVGAGRPVERVVGESGGEPAELGRRDVVQARSPPPPARSAPGSRRERWRPGLIRWYSTWKWLDVPEPPDAGCLSEPWSTSWSRSTRGVEELEHRGQGRGHPLQRRRRPATIDDESAPPEPPVPLRIPWHDPSPGTRLRIRSRPRRRPPAARHAP